MTKYKILRGLNVKKDLSRDDGGYELWSKNTVFYGPLRSVLNEILEREGYPNYKIRKVRKR